MDDVDVSVNAVKDLGMDQQFAGAINPEELTAVWGGNAIARISLDVGPESGPQPSAPSYFADVTAGVESELPIIGTNNTLG